ncbi:MAG: hypothetical protein ACXACW_15675 [Candidatus Hodarchaeales archaeon]|jgi:hypothetical protein
MYEIGDVVNIIYTDGDYTSGIGIYSVLEKMKENPHIVNEVGGNWVGLEGDGFLWGHQIIELANREPDWEI